MSIENQLGLDQFSSETDRKALKDLALEGIELEGTKDPQGTIVEGIYLSPTAAAMHSRINLANLFGSGPQTESIIRVFKQYYPLSAKKLKI